MICADQVQNNTSMEVAKWVALVVAVLGLCLILSDLIINIKKRRNTRLNIIGLVFFVLSVLCFVLTQFVFADQLPSVLSLIWIVFLICYFVCDVIIAVCIGKQNKQNGVTVRKRKGKKNGADDGADGVGGNGDVADGGGVGADENDQPVAGAQTAETAAQVSDDGEGAEKTHEEGEAPQDKKASKKAEKQKSKKQKAKEKDAENQDTAETADTAAVATAEAELSNGDVNRKSGKKSKKSDAESEKSKK